MPPPTDATQPKSSGEIKPHFLPNFRIRQWLLVGLLCISGLWLLVDHRDTNKAPEFESVSMASAKADYYLESFTLLSAKPDGAVDFTLSAETLIHLPTEAMARVENPALTVNSAATEKGRWRLTANTGLLPDHGQTIDLTGSVQLQQLAEGQTPLRLTTPSLRLDRKKREINSDAGVQVAGPGWQLRADKMTGLIETGKLIFRENNHVQYSPSQHAD